MSANEQEKDLDGFQDRVVKISRVAKVVKGGRRFSFSALVVVGDRKGQVGYGIGNAGEVPDAIKKASEHAKKHLVSVQNLNGSIPFEVEGHFGSSLVKMYPAKSGKGIIAGGAVRMIMELGGIKDIVCKAHGSKNGHNIVRATFDGISQLVTVDSYAKDRGLAPEEVLQKRPAQKKLEEQAERAAL
ncbi:MAG: 30S ribosomal protein S5 [Deltaproteobacteria bacterium]|nr:30S ribosomal protein S5 [Deltaproteobacteria bacterium]